MSKKIIEVRFHGRGGQGAKTASLLLGDAALDAGKHIQAFPEYGPERTGAPVRAFTRISDSEIRVHSGVTNPDVVVVIDPTLMDTQDVLEGLEPNGKIIINTQQSSEEMKKKVSLKNGQKLYTIDATKIALDTLGRAIMNVPMLGALVKVTGLVDLEVVKNKIRKKFEKKLSSRALEGNLEGIQKAYEGVRE